MIICWTSMRISPAWSYTVQHVLQPIKPLTWNLATTFLSQAIQSVTYLTVVTISRVHIHVLALHDSQTTVPTHHSTSQYNRWSLPLSRNTSKWTQDSLLHFKRNARSAIKRTSSQPRRLEPLPTCQVAPTQDTSTCLPLRKEDTSQHTNRFYHDKLIAYW